MTPDNIQDKIKALLAMAEHPNSNPHEAAMAMERAQALLLKHNLTMSQIKTGPDTYQAPAGIGKINLVEDIGFDWKSILLNTLAHASLCDVVTTTSKHQLHLFGSYDNVKSVLEMYNWLKTQLDFMVGRDWVTYRDAGGESTIGKWKASYFLGAISEIRDRLHKPYQEFAQGQGSTLVVYNNKALQTALHKVYPQGLGHTSGRRTIGSQDGLYAGKQAGHNVNLSQSKPLGSRLALPA